MSDPFDALLKAEKVLEGHEFAALVDFIERKDSQIANLTSENTRLREALESIRGTSTSASLGEWEQVFFRQQVLSCIHQAEMALEPPSHTGED